ncbi:MAG: substrate-binding domain-containing protein [Cyanobacteria bacterium P01_A01_bin.83]
MNQAQTSKTVASISIILASVAAAFAPIPGVKQNLVIVSGTELQSPLTELEQKFEQDHPGVDLQLEFQGSQDIANNFIDRKNNFQPHILIAASGEILEELDSRYSAQNNQKAFINPPQAIAKTVLVGVAWQERGQALFPDGQFSWSRIKQAMKQRNWSSIAAQEDWGSFDFVISDPTRSNSGQLALHLWLKSSGLALSSPEAESLVTLIKQSVYQPSRSTDILLQEFISRGANDGDLAIVYESIALYRWSQAKTTQGQPYRIYYPDNTVETIATAGIVKQNISKNTATTASKFVEYLTQPEQQKVFVKYGFRPVLTKLDISSVLNSPWSQNIPGAKLNLPKITPKSPNASEIGEIQRLWSRVPPK